MCRGVSEGLEVLPDEVANLAARESEREKGRKREIGQKAPDETTSEQHPICLAPASILLLGIWATEVITPCSSITDLCSPEGTSLLPSAVFQQHERSAAIPLTLDNSVLVPRRWRAPPARRKFRSDLTIPCVFYSSSLPLFLSCRRPCTTRSAALVDLVDRSSPRYRGRTKPIIDR